MKFPTITDNHKYFVFLVVAAVVIGFVFTGELRYFVGLFFAIAVMFFGVGKKLDRIHEDMKRIEDKIDK